MKEKHCGCHPGFANPYHHAINGCPLFKTEKFPYLHHINDDGELEHVETMVELREVVNRGEHVGKFTVAFEWVMLTDQEKHDMDYKK